jgi:AraC family transcriptional regulator of adaptative response / DNA-3-methyladenine glycosylase II
MCDDKCMPTTALTREAKYQIILQRDDQYDGSFFFAVKTTGIYCRPSCPARRPLQKNCLFFATIQAAIVQGFRACKRCRPDEPKADRTDLILTRIDTHESSVDELAALASISQRQLRRLVQSRTGATPFQLQQAKRLSRARELLTSTQMSITDVTFDAGFSSVRQFNDIFKRTYGVSPRVLRKKLQGN